MDNTPISEPFTKADSEFEEVSIISKFKMVDDILTIKDKNEQLIKIDQLLVSQLKYHRKQMLHNTNSVKHIRNIDLIHETKEKLSKGVSKRLALENLIINTL